MQQSIKFMWLVPFIIMLSACAVAPPQKQTDYVLVEKSYNKMYLVRDGKIFRSYNVSFGGNPKGHKQQEGDLRTPEGLYMLTYKNFNSQFYKSLKIDYPNLRDIELARLKGVSPGGDIVIHGMPNEAGNYLGPIRPRNWTRGCIAVRNHEMDELFDLIEIPTPIEIRP